MRYLLGVMWLTIAGFQAGVAATSDVRITAVTLFAVAGFSLGMSVWLFIKGAKEDKNA